jgi:hypothetical protein
VEKLPGGDNFIASAWFQFSRARECAAAGGANCRREEGQKQVCFHII